MSNKLRGIKRGQQKKDPKDPMVLAIVDGSNVFSLESCAFVPKSVAEKEGYIYVEDEDEHEHEEK